MTKSIPYFYIKIKVTENLYGSQVTAESKIYQPFQPCCNCYNIENNKKLGFITRLSMPVSVYV